MKSLQKHALDDKRTHHVAKIGVSVRRFQVRSQFFILGLVASGRPSAVKTASFFSWLRRRISARFWRLLQMLWMLAYPKQCSSSCSHTPHPPSAPTLVHAPNMGCNCCALGETHLPWHLLRMQMYMLWHRDSVLQPKNFAQLVCGYNPQQCKALQKCNSVCETVPSHRVFDQIYRVCTKKGSNFDSALRPRRK